MISTITRLYCVSSSKSIVQDTSRLLTYSEIHAENVRSRDENRTSEAGYGRIHSMQLQTQKELYRRRDAVSSYADRIALLSRVPTSNHNRSRSADIKGEVLCNHSSPVEVNELENDCNHQVVDCFGTGKRFYEANGRSRPTPYHTNALDYPKGVPLSSSDSKSVSRESSALKDILIKKLEAPLSILKAFSASSFSLLKNEKTSSVRGSTVHKRNPHDDDRILSERSKQRNGHIYDGGSIIELADDDSYCAHYDRLQSIKQAQLIKKGRGQGQGRSKVGNTAAAAGFSVLHTERSGIRKKKAPTDSSADQTNLKMKQREFFDIMSQTVNYMKEDNHYTEKNNEKEKVKFLENSILEHISGRLGNLRHSLNKMDFSRSGVINYEEFRSVIAQRGVNMSSADVQKVFYDRAIDSRNKGQINEGGITSHDLRYSSGLAVNIQQYIEHLSEREKERVEVVPREHSLTEESFSERLKLKNRDFLSQKKYDDYQSQHIGNDTHNRHRDEVATSSSRSKYSAVQHIYFLSSHVLRICFILLYDTYKV